jgi:hypothetical protein
MKLIETTVTETVVRMRYADDDDSAKAKKWIDFQVPLAALSDPRTPGHPLGDTDSRFLASVRLAALCYARDVISEEIQQLSRLADR